MDILIVDDDEDVRLRKDFPDLARRVIFATGWAEHDEVGPFLERTGRPVLRKPVDLGDLVRTVRQVAERGG
jgi:hypothetical protein